MNKQMWLLMIFCAAFSALPVRAQSGGTYSLAQSVVASGGGANSTGGGFRVDGTIGQNVAGTVSTGTSPTNNVYSLRGGFWTFNSLAPTAAQVSISGRVTTALGNGIRNVRVTLTTADGTARSTQTGGFGYFSFEEVEVGQVCVLEVASKRYVFAEPVRVLNVEQAVTNLDFVAAPPASDTSLYPKFDGATAPK